MKRFIIGDIHGNYKGLLQCLNRSKFNMEEDTLIILGDICDGYNQVRECIDLLLILNTIFIRGNHDQWFLNYLNSGSILELWASQGGYATLDSYGISIYDDTVDFPKSHLDYLNNSKLFYTLEDCLFVHGGIEPQSKVENNRADYILWDRSLLNNAYHYSKAKNNNYNFVSGYKEVFLGHTTTQQFKTDLPIHACNVWGLDTGAGWSGKLTIMDFDTKEFWQSDLAKSLYLTGGR